MTREQSEAETERPGLWEDLVPDYEAEGTFTAECSNTDCSFSVRCWAGDPQEPTIFECPMCAYEVVA